MATLTLAATVAGGVLVAPPAGAQPLSAELYTWGLNTDGQLGNGGTANEVTPQGVLLPSDTVPVSVAAGGDHTLAIGSNGTLYAWGLNNDGQLGNGTTTNASTPVVVSFPAGVTPTAVAAGQDFSLALGSNGAVYAWGYNGFGQLGIGDMYNVSVPVPVEMPAGVTATAIAAGANFALAVGSNGLVYAWGDGTDGALGDGSTSTKTAPVAVSTPAGATFTSVSAGASTGAALASNGTEYTWGYNGDGQLGVGTYTDKSTPVAASLPAGVTATAIAEGGDHSLAIGSNGDLYAWGYNGDGQVGNGTTANVKSPVAVSLPSGARPVSVAAGMDASMAVGSDGNVYTWGYNGNGQLGDGSIANLTNPAAASMPTLSLPASAVFSGSSAGQAVAIALPTDVPTATSLASSASSTTYGQSVTLTATVVPSDGGGTVSFSNGGSTIASCASVALSEVSGGYQASCTTPALVPATYAFSATYSGDAVYLSSASSATSVSVTPAPLVVTASSASTVYGSVVPPVTPSYAGFVNGDEPSSLTTAPVCSTTASASSPVGTYLTTCSGASDPDYLITYDNGQVTVDPAPLSVVASSSTMTYGGSVPAITPSYAGFVNGDTASSLSSPPTCSTTATPSSPVGTYPSTCSGASDPNYVVNDVNGLVSVGAAPLVITASSGTSTYGSAPAAVTPSYSGFVNGDTAASLSSPPACTTSASSSSPAGTYATSCSGASDPDYTISYAPGTDTVTPAPLTVTASSGMSSYGSAPPAISPNITGLVNGDSPSALGDTVVCTSSASASSPVGTYSTTCSGANDPNYDITYVDGSDTVTPAPLSITASSGTMTYGGSVPAINDTVTGLQNGENPSVLGDLQCSTTATSASQVGTYPSSCEGASDANYALSYFPGQITVDPAPLTITGSSGTMTYGGTVPPVTPVVTGLVNGDTVASLGGGLQCGTAADSTSTVGPYASSCWGAESTDYSIEYADGVIQVTPAPLEVTASSASMTYGGSVPAVTPSYSGFVNGDTAASLSAAPACTTTATSSSPVGTYPTSCSGAADPNYQIGYQQGSLQVATAVLTVTASSASMTYGGAVPAVTPSYSGFVNGDTPASLTTPATCSAAASSSSAVGDYATSCQGAADANYAFSYVEGTLEVDPAPLTIAASSASMTYGGSVPAVTPSYSGFVNGDTPASLASPPTCSTTASSSSGVGTYPTSCSGASDPNYDISYAGGQVVVGTAVLVVSASSASMTYGGSVPAVTPSYSGFVNGDTPASLTTAPVCTTAATATSPVGSYASSCAGAGDPDYTITYVDGEVSIAPAPLSLTASSGTVTYGGSAPAIVPSYSGFVNGDSAASLTTQPTCSTVAGPTSPVGSYASSCSGASDPNYTIDEVAGAVTVTPAPLVVTASSPSVVYGSNTPATVTPSYSGFVNGDSESSLTAPAACSSTYAVGDPVGAYPTSCEGASDPDYAVTYEPGAVDVEPATLEVTASSATIQYGGAAPSITASYSGFVNGDSVTSLTTAPSCASPVTSVSGVGTYASACSGVSDPNYDITYLPGSVQVVPAPLTVTASSAMSVYGGPVAATAPSYSGFVNGDTASSLTSPATCTSAATPSSPVGSYATSCSGAVDANYSISYVNGSDQVTPAALTVTASSGATTYGSTPAPIGASYAGFVNGDGPGSLTTSATCSTSATPTSPVGEYPTSCSGASDPNYTISYIDGSLTVSPAPLVITAGSSSMTYGGAVPPVTASYTGFVAGDSASSLTTAPTCTTAATSSSPVGTYATSCSGAVDPNYAISYVDGVTAVGRATLVVTASSATMTYGGAVPPVTASYTGFVAGDSASSLTTAPTCTTAATAASPVGTYATSCSGAVDPDYTIVYVNGTVAVAPAPVTVTASSATTVYGSAAPAITASVSGLPSGHSPSELTGLSCSTAVSATSPVGSYASTCGGVTNPDYAVSYVAGTVSVTPATLTVTANNVTKAYGAAVPALTATISGYVNGQTLATSGVTGTPACTTTATATSPGGTYPITCSVGTLAAQNYTFSFVAGVLTVSFSTVMICDHTGAVTVTSGESVLVSPGCTQDGNITVDPGGSLQIQGAIMVGSISATGATLIRVCSTNLLGAVSATGSQAQVVLGNDTTSCSGDAVAGTVSVTSSAAGVVMDGAALIGTVDIQSNSGGVAVVGGAYAGVVTVAKNSGGATVDDNVVIGELAVTGNTGAVVDHPNIVVGLADLQ